MLFKCNSGVKVIEAAQINRNVCGRDAISDRTAKKRFNRFRNGNFNVNDGDRSNQLTKLDEERLNILLHENPRQTTPELAEELNCDHTTILK